MEGQTMTKKQQELLEKLQGDLWDIVHDLEDLKSELEEEGGNDE